MTVVKTNPLTPTFQKKKKKKQIRLGFKKLC